MVAITQDAMGGLRNALMRDMGYAAAGYLQEAGYAGGGALFEAFRNWLAARGGTAPEDLSLSDFQSNASDFFRECGWGSLEVGGAPRHRGDARFCRLGRSDPRRGSRAGELSLLVGDVLRLLRPAVGCSASGDGSGVSLSRVLIVAGSCSAAPRSWSTSTTR